MKVINESNKLIAFGYVCRMGLEHGYMEDIIVHLYCDNKIIY